MIGCEYNHLSPVLPAKRLLLARRELSLTHNQYFVKSLNAMKTITVDMSASFSTDTSLLRREKALSDKCINYFAHPSYPRFDLRNLLINDDPIETPQTYLTVVGPSGPFIKEKKYNYLVVRWPLQVLFRLEFLVILLLLLYPLILWQLYLPHFHLWPRLVQVVQQLQMDL